MTESKVINGSGITPIGERSLVRVVKTERKVGSIFLPENYADRQDMAQLEAEYLEAGEIADAQLDTWPQPGDHVLITKFAGLLYTGTDGEEYRLVEHADIVGILRK